MVVFERVDIQAKDSPYPSFFDNDLWRARVPGGWLIMLKNSIAFYPDPQHSWTGRETFY